MIITFSFASISVLLIAYFVFQQSLQWSESTLDSDAEEVVLEPGDYIVAMDYLMEKESLLLGSSTGCLLLYNVDEKTTDVVGRLEGGVKTIASSPDGALISVTTGFGQLLIMTNDWEVLFETSLDPHVSFCLHDLTKDMTKMFSFYTCLFPV